MGHLKLTNNTTEDILISEVEPFDATDAHNIYSLTLEDKTIKPGESIDIPLNLDPKIIGHAIQTWFKTRHDKEYNLDDPELNQTPEQLGAE